MKNKLIVDRHQARKIKEGKCDLVFNMRRKQGEKMEHLAIKKFLDQVFWVAEPLCAIRRGDERYVGHFSCDETPDGWSRYTLDRAGSRVHYGEHRHMVKCSDVKYFSHGAGGMFSVLVTLELVK